MGGCNNFYELIISLVQSNGIHKRVPDPYPLLESLNGIIRVDSAALCANPRSLEHKPTS